MAAVDSTRKAKSFRCIKNPPYYTFKACPAAKWAPRPPPHGGHPGVSFPLFAQFGAGLFHHFTPPYSIFNSNNLQSFAILFVYFLSGRRRKNTLPLPVKAKKGCFMPGNGRGGAACKKPYFFPPGVSVLNKKKEGRCTHIWCSCHLNLFQHLCIIFLLSGTRAFQMSLRRPIWDAFSFYRHSEGRCGMCRRGGPLSDGLHQPVTPSPYL